MKSTEGTSGTEDSAASQKRLELERGLQLSKEYWLEIYKHIKDCPLLGAEWYVATDAYFRLRLADERARLWNSSEEGRQSCIPAKSFPDLKEECFREPERLCRDENLKPEDLALIAARWHKERFAGAVLSPGEAMAAAHKLRVEAGRYWNALPERKQGTAELIEFIEKGSETVTFAEIKASNAKSSRRLPLLPPVGQKRKGIPEEDQDEEPLSDDAIKEAVRKHFEDHKAGLTEEEHRKALDDYVGKNCVSLRPLCDMRWERFERKWNKRRHPKTVK